MDGFDFNTSMLDNFFLTEQDLQITPAPSLFPTTNTSHKGSFHIDPFASSPAIPNTNSNSSFQSSIDDNYLRNPITELPELPGPTSNYNQQQPQQIQYQQDDRHQTLDNSSQPYAHTQYHNHNQTIEEPSPSYAQYHQTTNHEHPQHEPYSQEFHQTIDEHSSQPYTQYQQSLTVNEQPQSYNHYNEHQKKHDARGAAEFERKTRTNTKQQTTSEGVRKGTKRQKQARGDHSSPNTDRHETDPFSQQGGSSQQNDTQGGLPPGKMLLPSRLQTLAMINLDKKKEPVDEEAEKRERNCAASARFRKKKREEQLATERQAQQMKARYEDLLARRDKLLAEKTYLEELLALKEQEREGREEPGQEHEVVLIP